jgi:hypothetical protein
LESWYDCNAEDGGERRKGGDGLLVMFVDEPNEVFLTGWRAAGVGGKRPERGWLVESGRGEEGGEERGGVKREVEKLEDGRALGKKESEHAGSRRKRMLVCGRRVSVVSVLKLAGLGSGGKVGGMEIEQPEK